MKKNGKGMELKTVGSDGDLKVGDEVRFVFETADGSGCLVDPYQVVDATVYFVTREFTDTTATEYSAEFSDPSLQAEYSRLKRAVCDKAKETVKAASTGPLTLSGLQSVDGIVLSLGDRVLVKDQADGTENGIYVVSNQGWARSLDASSDRNVISGMYLFVENGVQNISTGWVLETANPVTVGSSALRFLKFATQWSPSSPDEREEENSRRLAMLERMIEDSKLRSSFFYKDAVPVRKFGGEIDPSTGEIFPAWLNPDRVPAEMRSRVSSDNILSQVEEGGNYTKGKFELRWDTSGMREGDYFVCWSWRPSFGSDTLSAHQFFQLSGDGNATASIPTHRSRPDKYEILMERYTPEMFKMRISDSDLSPEVISEFGKAVAKGFSFVEDQASAVIDLLDANVVHEQLLPLLANMFNMKVKSGDPTLWRRQIKKALPNFKRKGSVAGLREVLQDSGMRLLRLARLWQVVPKYTFQEHFTFSGSNDFRLSRTPATPLDGNFRLFFRPAAGGDWVSLESESSSSSSSSGHWSSDFIEISGDMMMWVGSELAEGDSLRVLYRFRSIPSGEQAKEDYVRSLPLMDDRDERDQEYPPKNWNVHLIEEDDEYFDLLVPVRHPLADPIIWGRVRTEFPYSENLYNMEEYNGSKRDSLDPCDIDKEFLDACGQCASSKFNMDVEIDMLSDDGFKELRQIVEENMPFHAVPNSFNLWGGVNEFVGQVDEEIRAMVSFSNEDVLLAGEGQKIFHRSMYPEELDSLRRDLLASMEAVESPSGSENWTGVLRNTKTVLLSMPTNEVSDISNADFAGMTQGFDSLNIKNDHLDADPFDSDNLLEIFGVTTKYYSISSIDRSSAELYGNVDSSLVGPLLEYRASNRVGDFNADISQYQETIFADEDSDFSMVGIVSQHDLDLGLATGDPWSLLFEDKNYTVVNVLPDGTLLLNQTGTVDPIVGWELRDGSELMKSGAGGFKEVYNYGLVEINSPSGPLRETLKPGDFVYLDWAASPRIYEIRSFKAGEEKFYLKGYSEGGVGAVDLKIYRRVMDRKLGQIGYSSLFMVADDNLELAIPVSDENRDEVLQNYLVFVRGEYYNIAEVDGNLARLSGPASPEDTLGSAVEFNIYKFSKGSLTLPGKLTPPYDEEPVEYQLDRVGRSGGSIITNTEGGSGLVSAMLNSGGPLDVVAQGEAIEYEIEYKKE